MQCIETQKEVLILLMGFHPCSQIQLAREILRLVMDLYTSILLEVLMLLLVIWHYLAILLVLETQL